MSQRATIAGPARTALACIALVAAVPGPAALAQVPGQGTRIELSRGNIDVMVADGTTVAMAPETDLDIRAAATTADGITDITVGQGQVHVSTVLARGSGIARVRTGGEVWEIERAAVLIAIGPGGISATMLHGRRLGAPGRGAELRQPGMAMRLDPSGALSTVRPPPGEVAGMMRATGAPGMPPPGGPAGGAGGSPGGPSGAPPPPGGSGHDGAPAAGPGAPPPGQAPGAFPAPPGGGAPGLGPPPGPGGALPAPGRAIGAPGPRAGGGAPGRRVGPALQQRRSAAAGRAQEAPGPSPGRPDVPGPGVPSPGVPSPGVPSPGAPSPGVPSPGVPRPGVPRPGVPAPGIPGPAGPPNAPILPNPPGLQNAPGLPNAPGRPAPPGPRPDR